MENIEIEFLTSARDKPMILVNGIKFSKAHIAKDGKTRWRCGLKTCKAKCYTAGKHSYFQNEVAEIHGVDVDRRSKKSTDTHSILTFVVLFRTPISSNCGIRPKP